MKNRRLWTVGSSVCLVFALFFGCGERAGEKEYKKAMESWEDGDLVRAQTLLEKSIRKSAGNEKKSAAGNQLGIILWQIGKPEESITAFRNSCELSEELSGANLNLGMALYHAGRPGDAELEFSKILREQPSSPAAKTFDILIDMQKKDWEKASRKLTEELRARPANPSAQNALAIAELHLSRSYDGPVTRLKQLTSAYPEYAPAAYNLAVIHEQWMGETAEAVRWYQRYLQKAGENGAFSEQSRKSMARLSSPGSASGNPANRPVDPSAAARFMADGAQLHQAGKFQDAIAAYAKAIQADPSQKNAHYNMGLACYALKRYRETAAACGAALKIDPAYGDARYMLALSLYQEKKWNEAEQETKRLLSEQPQHAQAKSLLRFIADARKKAK